MVEKLVEPVELDLGKKGRVRREPPSARKIELKEGVYRFDREAYKSVKKRTSSGSWRLTKGDDGVIETDLLTDSEWLTDSERVSNERVSKGIVAVRTRKYYQGDARVLTPWIMYELYFAYLNDQADFVMSSYVICHVSCTGEQEGGLDEELSPPYEEVLAPNTVISDNNCPPNAQGLFITEEAIDTNRKKPQHTYLKNMIVGIILFLALTGNIISSSSVSLENSKITNTIGLCESCRCFSNVQTNSNSSSSISVQTETNRDTFLIRHFTTFHSLFVPYLTVSPPAKKVHQVFLNFRGGELRHNFVSHLGDALERHNIKLFVDTYEHRGKDLKNLFVRIEESSIALAIFSTRYPESRWCMDELVKMNKLADQGKLSVIPIFYKVEAGDVKTPTGGSEFGKNFWRLAEASSGDQIMKWKDALKGIGNMMGCSVKDYSVESDSIKEIVKEVQRELIGLEEEVRSPYDYIFRFKRSKSAKPNVVT